MYKKYSVSISKLNDLFVYLSNCNFCCFSSSFKESLLGLSSFQNNLSLINDLLKKSYRKKEINYICILEIQNFFKDLK